MYVTSGRYNPAYHWPWPPGHNLAHVHLAVDQHPEVLFHRTDFQPLFPKPAASHGVVMTKVHDLALCLVEPHTICHSPLIQPVQTPPSYPTADQHSHPSWRCPQITEAVVVPRKTFCYHSWCKNELNSSIKEFYLAVLPSSFEFLEFLLPTMPCCLLHVAKVQVFLFNSGSLVLFPHP